LVVIAPERAARPGAKRPVFEPPSDEELAACPFCSGREERTPPETFALAEQLRDPDTPGWQVRVVPNLFPAFERQEVVVHVPRHARSLAELDDEELGRVALAWRERAKAAHSEGFAYVHAFVNEGREAGASLPHSHSQLVWLREPPPAVAVEEGGECRVCALLRDSETYEIASRDGLVLLAAPAGRLPYELLLAPAEHVNGGAFDSELLPDALRLLGEAIRRLRALEGALPLNAWVHDGAHWHFEILPRLSVLASIELGAGIYVNTVPPERAAAILREVAG
jgi:UDPglucose--hexose-1-phosphate uridylyltransferase